MLESFIAWSMNDYKLKSLHQKHAELVRQRPKPDLFIYNRILYGNTS